MSLTLNRQPDYSDSGFSDPGIGRLTLTIICPSMTSSRLNLRPALIATLVPKRQSALESLLESIRRIAVRPSSLAYSAI